MQAVHPTLSQSTCRACLPGSLINDTYRYAQQPAAGHCFHNCLVSILEIIISQKAAVPARLKALYCIGRLPQCKPRSRLKTRVPRALPGALRRAAELASFIQAISKLEFIYNPNPLFIRADAPR
jgi:hypothetical protein